MKIFTMLIICFVGLFAFGQADQGTQPLLQSEQVRSYSLRTGELKGSEYLNENFNPVKFSDSDKTYQVRYNAHQDEMEIIKNGESYNLPKKFDYTITFLNKPETNYKVYSYKVNKQEKKGFFLLINPNKDFSLLVKEEIRLYDEVKGERGISNYKPPTLKRVKDKYFIGFKDNTAIEIPRKKKDFYLLFKKHSEALEMFVKGNKLNIKNKEDLIQIFNHYNTLN